MSIGRPRDGTLSVAWQATELFRYVWRPADAAVESPRPYLHPVRTLAGELVSAFRPPDHVWHKGISWTLPNLGPENFWGGPTYQRGYGYRQLANNGRMRHDRFDAVRAGRDRVTIAERLTWITESGEDWITEQRRLNASVLDASVLSSAAPGSAAPASAAPASGAPDSGGPAGGGAWRLGFSTVMRNTSGRPLPIGSPGTEGRADGGYGGLFWRGPAWLDGGTVLTPDGPGGDEVMGRRGPWLGFTGSHAGLGRAATLLFCDRPENFSFPSQWFVRTGIYACACPAPFFSSEYLLADGDALELSYDMVIADGTLDVAACGDFADRARREH